MNGFLDENEIDPADTLEKLNERFAAWLETHHEHHVNRTTGQEPEERYKMGRTRQNFVSLELIERAVMREVKRKVDNSGNVSFKSKDFYVGLSYAHREVSLLYVESDCTVLYMENEDGNVVEIRATVTGRYTNTPKLPKAQPVDKSTHYLDDLTKSKKASKEKTEEKQETLFDYCEKKSATQDGITQTISFDDGEEL